MHTSMKTKIPLRYRPFLFHSEISLCLFPMRPTHSPSDSNTILSFFHYTLALPALEFYINAVMPYVFFYVSFFPFSLMFSRLIYFGVVKEFVSFYSIVHKYNTVYLSILLVMDK